MNNLGIHWRGYPHRRLPRIRVVSNRRLSAYNPSIAHAAAENASRYRLGSALEQERRKYQAPRIHKFGFRRRRNRSSRSSRSTAIATRARRRASVRARHNIQIFGWNTPEAEISSRVTSEKANSGHCLSKKRPTSISVTPLREVQTESIAVDSKDGPSGSIFRKSKSRPENLYSLIHIPEDPHPLYLSTQIPSTESQPPRRADYAHIRPLGTVSNGTKNLSPCHVDRRRTYDPRIDPRRARSPPRNRSAVPPSSSKDPRASFGSPAFWQSVGPLVWQSNKDPSSAAQSAKSIARSLLTDSLPSRTPSQRKALRHFSRGLENHLRSFPNPVHVNSPSVTTVSAHTIQDFRPYLEQFNSAGLAVTSSDQLRTSEVMAKWKRGSSPPPTPAKDKKWTSKKPQKEPSFSSGTTVMGWTPPHEADPQKPPPTRPSYSTLSSGHDVMSFTPPHERSAPPPITASSRKSLPWLRQQESPEVPPPKSNTKTREYQIKAKAVPKDSFGPLIMNLPTTPNENIYESRIPAPITTTWSEVKFSEVKQSPQNTVPRERMTDRKTYLDMAIQVDTGDPDDNQYTPPSYANASTQTDNANSRTPKVEPRAPLTSGKSKSFPVSPIRCKGECQQPPPQPLAISTKVALPRSKQYADQANQPIPFSCISLQSRPFQPSPVLGSAHKIYDRGEIRDQTAASLTCPVPLLPTDPGSGISPSALDLECKTSTTRKGFNQDTTVCLNQECTKRAVPGCQQCMASKEKSVKTSPQHSQLAQATQRSVEQIGAQVPITEDFSKERFFDAPFRDAQPPGEEALQTRVVDELIAKFANQAGTSVPLRKPSQSKLRFRTITTTAQAPQMQDDYRPKSPLHPSESFASTSSLDRNGISDRQVFQGLHVATAAACDEDVNAWIEEITGCDVRKFLAELSAFEGLGFNTLAGVAKRAKRQRRQEVKVWEKVRERKMRQMDRATGGGGEDVGDVVLDTEEDTYRERRGNGKGVDRSSDGNRA